MPSVRFGVVCLLCLLAPATLSAGEYRDLFNGKDFEGWVIDGPTTAKTGETIWTVENGNIVCLGKVYGFLRYDKQQFSDFALRVEYRFEPASKTNKSGNSGLGIRTGVFDPKKSQLTRPSYAAYEIQLLDDAGKPPDVHSSGSLYRYVAPTANPVKPAPEWNTVEVQCVGPSITVIMNGQKILEANQNAIEDLKQKPAGAPAPKDKPLKGYVCLQSHSGKVEFRRVQIRELPASKGE